MAKFKVGDKVRVKNFCEYVPSVGFLDTMEKRCGTVVTISKVFDDDVDLFGTVCYYLEEEMATDEIAFFWAEEWLEEVKND